jgi:hypothetical protein
LSAVRPIRGVREVLGIEIVDDADRRRVMGIRDEQRRDRLRNRIAAHLIRRAGNEHVAVPHGPAAAHPGIEAAVGFGMDMPEARVQAGKRCSMLRAEPRNSRHVGGARRADGGWKRVRAEPLHHIEGDRLIAMASIERPQGRISRARCIDRRNPHQHRMSDPGDSAGMFGDQPKLVRRTG